MGRTNDDLPFLSILEYNNFNNIGYSGKTLDGVKTTWLNYLNSLEKGLFKIECTQFDTGDHHEKFIIIQVTQ
jgi:hypothetical protein